MEDLIIHVLTCVAEALLTKLLRYTINRLVRKQ